jgi:hypothetical protein
MNLSKCSRPVSVTNIKNWQSPKLQTIVPEHIERQLMLSYLSNKHQNEKYQKSRNNKTHKASILPFLSELQTLKIADHINIKQLLE